MTKSAKITIKKSAFCRQKLLFAKDSADFKYNVKFNNEDLILLDLLKQHYSLRNLSELIEVILCNYLKNSLNDHNVGKDIALLIALVADAKCSSVKTDSDVTCWSGEVLTSSRYKEQILSGIENGTTSHSEGFLPVGMKLLQFCEKHHLMGTPEYKMIFKSLEKWNKVNKSKDRS